MNKIFSGLFFLFINIDINTLNIMPAFVGYLLILLGMGEVMESGVFAQAKPLVAGAAVYTLLTWLMDLFGMDLGLLNLALAVVGITLQLLVTYRLVQGVEELEEFYHSEMGADRLRRGWQVMTICLVLSNLLIWLLPALALAALVVSLVAAVYYMVKFYQSKRNYEVCLEVGRRES